LRYTADIKKLHLGRKELYKENDYFNEQAYIIDCTANQENILASIQNPVTNKDAEIAKPVSKPEPVADDLEEIDLHIEEILDVTEGLSSGDILNAQLARFTTALDGALKSKTKRIVFIHGVGNGRLKYELCKTLDTKYPSLQYQDASYAEYGFGATMVIIRK
jgi:dsDNA-specific endonuclease/ATPase MutS2